jgi:hypothetical protein
MKRGKAATVDRSFPFTGLMHLWVAFVVFILRRIRNPDTHRVDAAVDRSPG